MTIAWSSAAQDGATSPKKEEYIFRDYSIRIRETGVRRTQLEVNQKGVLVHLQAGQILNVGCNGADGKKLAWPIGENVTGGITPELIVRDDTPGSSGISDWYVYSMGERFELVAHIGGAISGEACPFQDLDGDGVPEFVTYDDAFRSFRTSNAESQFGRVVLRLFRPGARIKYRVAADLMSSPAPSETELATRAYRIRVTPGWKADEPPPTLGQEIVKLLFGGHPELARTLLTQAWPAEIPGREGYWLELQTRLSTRSPYWPEMKQFPDSVVTRGTPDTPKVATDRAEADFRLGSDYEAGRLVRQDYAEAARYYRSAAAKGHMKAQCALGVMYSVGKGVAPDYVEAAKWFKLAAENGYPTAQYTMGNLYLKGQGVPQDPASASEWYTKAALAGDTDAQTILAALYERGSGVPKDIVKAYAWSKLAADGGKQDARELCYLFQALMTRAQVEVGTKLAGQFKAMIGNARLN
jgi:TPR repeat protein